MATIWFFGAPSNNTSGRGLPLASNQYQTKMQWFVNALILLSFSAWEEDFSKSIKNSYHKTLSEYFLQVGNVAR